MKKIPKLPVQFEKPLKDYKAAYLRYQELRSRPGTHIPRLDSAWKKSQHLVLQIEEDMIKQYGKEVTEEMLEQVIGWRTLPRL